MCLFVATLALVFLGSLVAPPKLLFGRSLTAIDPDLFPMIVLAILAVLCAVQLSLAYGRTSDADSEDIASDVNNGWRRGVVFFGIMVIYALLMSPIGFLLSSALATAALSWQIGNRSIIQIVVLSFGAPILLYLGATRLLAVSLPELNVIELAYSRLLALF